ncbi:MAG TPA: NAD(P)H-binding protein [Rhizomicrobium sp.]|jgi:uncharacterized protein YbjT (DUF2867 family)|nr:NAD(P)H-binding protein [Rhizomicrobium sp.]
MTKLLVIGASGFVGGYLARALLADGHAVRCLARDPAKVQGLAALGCEIVQGDMSDPASLHSALDGIAAVYICVQTLSAQPASPAGQGFMAVETTGMQNIVAACKTHGTRRAIYVTALGMAPDSPSEWVRGRWQIEQSLVNSGLDATVIRPGMIVGAGGRGFAMTASRARSRLAIVLGNGRTRMRHVAIGDLVYYLIGVLGEPRTYGQCYDVGGDELYSGDRLIDIVADVLGRPHPAKLHIPLSLLGALAPLIERLTKVASKGAIKGIADGLNVEGIGDPLPIRAVLPRPPLDFRRAARTALNIQPKE